MSSVPVSPIGPAADPRGVVSVRVEVSQTWPISVLVEGWSDEEKRGLLDGGQDARDALEQVALEKTLDHPIVDDERYIVTFEKRREEATSVR